MKPNENKRRDAMHCVSTENAENTETPKPKIINHRSEYDLICKLKKYQEKRFDLLAKLEAGYNESIIRELHVVENHITTCEQRLNGELENDFTCQVCHIPVSNIHPLNK